jgi:hypothetical protein
MRPFEDEVNEILLHYHDVARAHGMDRALREAVESNVFTRRELAGVRRRVEELQRQLAGEEVEALDFLWQEYVQADPTSLTEDAKELAEQVRQKVRELAGAERLEERIEELEGAIRRVIEDLRDHEDEPVYGPYGLAGTQCIVHDSKLCEALDELQTVLDKGEEG